jgi:hypothetical protein
VRTPAIVDLDTTFFQAYNASENSYGKISGTDFVNALQSVVIGPNLTGIAALTVSANQVPYYLDNAGNAATYTVSSFMRSVSNSADGPTLLSNVGGVSKFNIGTSSLLVSSANKVAVQAAINNSVGARLIFPAGEYDMTGLTGVNNIEMVARGEVIFKRPASDVSSNPIISFNGKTGFIIEGKFYFDGNKASQTVGANNIEIVGCSDYTIAGINSSSAKATAGYGSGIVIVAGANQSVNRKGIVQDCTVSRTDGPGIYVSKEYYLDIIGNVCEGSGVDGIQLANIVFPPVADVFQSIAIRDNRCLDNAENGINCIGFYTGQGTTGVILGNGVPAERLVDIDGNFTFRNAKYGIAWQGAGGLVRGNVIEGNGSSGGIGGGLVCNCADSIISENVFQSNVNFQLDAGGAQGLIIANNKFIGSPSVPTIDINVGGTQNSMVIGNNITQGGSQNCTGIKAIGIEATEPTNPINLTGIGLTVADNRIASNGAALSIGIHITEGYEWAIVRNNDVAGAPTGRGYFLEVERLIQEGNTSSDIYANGLPVQTIAANDPLIIPDVGEKFYISGNTNFSSIYTTSYNTFRGRVRNVVMLAQGTGYNYANPPTVAFSGGGGSGAAGTAQIDTSGHIVDIIITNFGSGYTSAPTVTISGGSGSGASALAQIGCNNFDGRQISLMFQGTPTIGTSGNLGLSSAHSVSVNSILRLEGHYGSWFEASYRQ